MISISQEQMTKIAEVTIHTDKEGARYKSALAYASYFHPIKLPFDAEAAEKLVCLKKKFAH